ncbi:hypothetical protein RvY_07194-2 [Ramazzottius varieornatus]|nr:hypothetical protein RvY_07194-2 [Ramazzottius varieornatus]
MTSEKPKEGGTGAYVRHETPFRNWITVDGSSGFPAEAGRYHLYVSLACPWASRTLVGRKLKGLEDVISVDIVDWLLDLKKGWAFNPQRPGCTPDTVNGKASLKEIYQMVEANYDGRITVPVLWDKKQKKIVNNESSEILRMFNSEFNAFGKTDEQRKLDLYPAELRKEIDSINEWVYRDINNGVYKAGFATTQEAYDPAAKAVFDALDKVESILSAKRFLTGNQLTEADVRLFTTLVRFDTVYNTHFKCNRRRIIDYKNIWGYTRDIYQTGVIGETVDIDQIVNHYYQSQTHINPKGIVPIGPIIDFNSEHDRGEM